VPLVIAMTLLLDVASLTVHYLDATVDLEEAGFNGRDLECKDSDLNESIIL